MPLRRRTLAITILLLASAAHAAAATSAANPGFGLEPASGPVEDFAPRIQADLVYWRQMVAEHHIKIEP